MNGFKTKIGRLRYKLAGITAGISTAIMMSPVTAFAADNGWGAGDSGTLESKGGAVASGMITEVIKWIGGAFSIVGALFGFMGVWKIIQAFRNDNNPEAISSGAKDLVVGGLMIALGVIAGTGTFNKMIGLQK